MQWAYYTPFQVRITPMNYCFRLPVFKFVSAVLSTLCHVHVFTMISCIVSITYAVFILLHYPSYVHVYTCTHVHVQSPVGIQALGECVLPHSAHSIHPALLKHIPLVCVCVHGAIVSTYCACVCVYILYVHVCACMHVCVACMHVCVCACCMHACVCVYMYACVCIYL